MGTSTIPMDEVAIRKRYDELLHSCRRVCDDAVNILNDALVRASIRIDSVTGRVKSLQSLLDKMARTGKEFEQIHDLVGLRVVCLFRSQIDPIAEVIREEFNAVPGLVENKFEVKDIDTFGYLDVKLVVRLRKEHVLATTACVMLRDFTFEIQIRTVGMHAWATVSHHLDYKMATQAPRELRRDFQALSALFHLADSQFEAFYLANQKLSEIGQPVPAALIDLDSNLDLESLFEYLQVRFPDRVNAATRGTVSQFLLDLSEAHIYRLAEVDRAIDHWLPAVLHYEETYPPGTNAGEKNRFTAVGLARIAVASEFAQFAEGSTQLRFVNS